MSTDLEQRFVFFVSWNRLPYHRDHFKTAIKFMTVRKFQTELWRITTKALFGLIKSKPTEIEYSESSHSVSSLGTESECKKLLAAFENGEHSEVKSATSKIIRALPFNLKRKGKDLAGELSTNSEGKIQKVIDTLGYAFIFLEYGVCLESDFVRSSETDVREI